DAPKTAASSSKSSAAPTDITARLVRLPDFTGGREVREARIWGAALIERARRHARRRIALYDSSKRDAGCRGGAAPKNLADLPYAHPPCDLSSRRRDVTKCESAVACGEGDRAWRCKARDGYLLCGGIFASLNTTCSRLTGSYFLSSSLLVCVRLFLVV